MLDQLTTELIRSNRALRVEVSETLATNGRLVRELAECRKRHAAEAKSHLATRKAFREYRRANPVPKPEVALSPWVLLPWYGYAS